MTVAISHVGCMGLAAALLVGGLGCSSADSAAEADSSSGRSAAAVPATATAQTVSEFELKDYRGKVVVLNFWATWCGPCRIEIPSLVRLRNSFDPKEVAIVGISVDAYGTPKQVEGMVVEIMKSLEINYAVFIDSEQTLPRDLLGSYLYGVPTTLVIDQKGEIRQTHVAVPRDRKGRLNPYSVLGEEVQALLDEA